MSMTEQKLYFYMDDTSIPYEEDELNLSKEDLEYQKFLINKYLLEIEGNPQKDDSCLNRK